MRLRFVLFGAATLAIVPDAPPVQAQAAPKELPKEMVGIWGFDAQACKDEDSDGRVVVEPRQVSSFAALFKLQAITKLPDGTLRASTQRFDEGEARRPRDALELKLVSPDTLSIKSGREPAASYRRCKTSAKAR